MQVLHARCCGLDVHKKTVVACVLLTHEDGTVERHLRTFGTMTVQLLALSDWLRGWGVTHVALESTGVYWWPVFNILEDEARTVVLVNPQHMKAVPGRKTDLKDGEWLADLLRHGLVKASFIPPRADPCLARPHAVSQVVSAGSGDRGQSAAQGARVGQHQTGRRGQ